MPKTTKSLVALLIACSLSVCVGSGSDSGSGGGSSGTCDSVAQEGVSLDVTLNFNTEQMILVENLNTAALTNIGDVLINVHNKTQWAFDQKSINSIVGFDADDMAGSTVQPVITLTGSPDIPPAGAITLCADIDTSTPSVSNCP